MNCKTCGYALRKGMNFCPKCGAAAAFNGKEIDTIIGQLCAVLLEWAKGWKQKNPNSCVYSKKDRELLEEMDAESDEVPYICCDIYNNCEEGYAITDYCFYYLVGGVFSSKSYSYTFEQLGEAKITYGGGNVYIDDEIIQIGLSDEEAKKLYKVLKAISRMYEPDDID